MCCTALSSGPATGQFMEELLIEDLTAVLASHAEEDVSADEFVQHLTLR